MVERSKSMAFAAGALVFPGGRIDEEDRQLAAGQAVDFAAARVAAIRETLEETAVSVGLSPVPDRKSCLDVQQALIAGRRFGQILAHHGLRLDLNALTPFARWVPQFHAVRRFDTLFFVAPAVMGSREPNVVEGECSGAQWITASNALELEQRGQARMIFPTRRNLERLALHDSFEAIAADAKAYAVEPITPELQVEDGQEFITIPEGIGYPVIREKLDGLWRG